MRAKSLGEFGWTYFGLECDMDGDLDDLEAYLTVVIDDFL